ncbi:MAG: hypothetical protein QOH42_843 [Blastocatellia bacterium]|nr:hypothetical protein [Blastocatellia bacterium]
MNDRELNAPSSLPLVIGVTGHRDLRAEDLSRLESVVRQIIEKFRNDLPHTPLVLLSALAEGADRLVARVALELGVRLIVPLPMRRDLYEMDFSTETSRAEFARLLGSAEHWFELPVIDGTTDGEISRPGVARDRQYEQTGGYIVRQSHLLIALWDGKYRDLVGGTSRVVRFQLEGVPEPYAPRSSPIDTPESGPVFHIVTPRVSDPKTAGEPFAFHKLFPKGYAGEADRFARICARLDTFNRDTTDQASFLSREVKKSEDYLFPESETQTLPSSLQTMRRHFAVADTLAIYFQRHTQSTLSLLFIFVILAAIAFDLYAHFFPERHWLLAIYLLLLAFAYLGINRRAKRRDYQNKYQDYRTLAEGLRVQFFWGVSGSSLSVADHYLRKQRGELDWICGALRAWSIPEPNENGEVPGTMEEPRDMNLVLQHWVIDQAKYFAKAAKRDHQKLERYEPYVKVLLRISVGMTVLVTAARLLPYPWRHELMESLEHNHGLHALLLALISLPAIGAAMLHGYIEKRALSEHAKQYSRMGIIFSNARQPLIKMLKDQHYQRAQHLIEELGKEALEENGDWVLLHRERPLEVPHAG